MKYICTRNPEKLGVDTKYIHLSALASELWPKNKIYLHQRPWKPRCRHKIFFSICYNKSVMAQKWNFGNGGLNLHITQNAQGCQLGIIRILDQHPPKISEVQKNFVGTQLQGYWTKTFTCRWA